MNMKILLIDDEYYILRGLRTLMERYFPELKVYASDNVTQGLELIYREKPDILITDICIAKDNGLDLIEKIRSTFSQMHIYIISGFSEFEYAKRAVGLHVKNYILKPIEHDKLVDMIRQSQKELLEDACKRENEELNWIQTRKKFMLDLVHTGSVGEERVQEMRRIHLDLLFQEYCVIRLKLKESWLLSDCRASVQLSNLNLFLEQIVYRECSVYPEIQFIMAETEPGEFTVVTGMKSGLGELDILKDSEEFIGKICSAVEREFQIEVEYEISGRHCGIDEFYQGYCESQGISFFSRNMRASTESRGVFLQKTNQWREKCKRAMEKEDFSTIKILLEIMEKKLVQEYSSSKMAMYFAYDICQEICQFVKDKFRENHIPYKECFEETEIREYRTIEMMHLVFKGTGENIQELQRKISQKKNSYIVDKVKTYIENFLEVATLENAAQEAGINPIYLSIIFKEITREHFRDYLIRKKIEKAKSLLQCSDMKIYEIGEKVGYMDVKYFGRMFKRYVGCTPNEFRLSEREKII